MNRIFGGIVTLFVIIMFLVGFIPTMESNVSSANITNTTVSSMVDMAVWVIPLAAVVGVILAGIGLMQWKKSRRF